MKLKIAIAVFYILVPSVLFAQEIGYPMDGCIDNDAKNYILKDMGIFTSFCCVIITACNVSSLHTDHPTRLGGAIGTFSGLLQTGAGCAILFNEEDIAEWGTGFATIGLITTYYGIKNIIGVRRNYFKEQGQMLTVTPIFGRIPSGSSSFGVMVEYSF